MNNNCKHNPSGITNPIKRFWRYIIHPEKIYYLPDNTGTCAHCGEMVTVPWIYFSWIIKLLYVIIPIVFIALPYYKIIHYDFLSGVSGEIVERISIAILGILSYVLFLVIDRIICATVLAFAIWEPYSESDYDIDVFTDTAELEKKSRKKIYLFSMVICCALIVFISIILE